MCPETLLSEASRVWNMLDDLAENNPEEYKKFIATQMQTGKEVLSRTPVFSREPLPKFVIEATVKGSKKPLLVTFCEWELVDEPTTLCSPVSIKGGEVFEVEGVQAVAIAFHPSVFSYYGFKLTDAENENEVSLNKRSQETSRFKLVWLGLSYLDKEKQISTIESNYVVCTSAPLRPKLLEVSEKFGTLKQILNSLGYKRPSSEGILTNTSLLPNSSSETPIQARDIVHVMTSELDRPEDCVLSESECFKLNLRNTVQKKSEHPLIEEICAGERSSGGAEVNSTINIGWHAEVLKPSYQSSTYSTPNQLKLTFDLPGVSSGKDCDVDLTEKNLSLTVTSAKPKFNVLNLDLPCSVDYLLAEAKFSQRRQRLVLTAPIVPGKKDS